MCQNTLADNGIKQTINCVDRPTSSSQSAPDQQCGVYPASNAGSTDPAQRIISVTLDSNFADASVSALMEGTDANYVVAANKAIVATLRNTAKELCHYNETTRDCVPTGQYVLTAGDTIDFTFGLGGWQKVSFYYAILAKNVT